MRSRVALCNELLATRHRALCNPLCDNVMRLLESLQGCVVAGMPRAAYAFADLLPTWRCLIDVFGV
ncbi:MAG: hypothetical protein ABW061_01955 [Polyangiaceae bacterium]